MSIIPNFIVNHIGNDVEINFSIMNTVGVGNKISVGGYGTYPIQAKYDTLTDDQYPAGSYTIDKFSIITKYKNS